MMGAMGMTVEEFKEKYPRMPVVSKKPVPIKAPAEILAIHAAMQALEQAGKTPRFVFWFDN
jgi:hypothetical protein